MKNGFWFLFILAAILGCASSSGHKVMSPALYQQKRSYSKAIETGSASAADSEFMSRGSSSSKTEEVTPVSATSSSDTENKLDAAAPAAQPSDIPEPPKPAAAASSEPNSSIARMIIYAAWMTVEVAKPDESLASALELMQKMGGFLSKRSDYSVEIRIPSAMFFAFIREIEQYGTVTSRAIASEDVTEQYADLAMRLDNLFAMRARLLVLLEQARKVEERLAIERELSRINEEIEVINGRMRMLKNLADYATIFLQFTPREAVPLQPQKQPTPFGWVRSFDISQLFEGQ